MSFSGVLEADSISGQATLLVPDGSDEPGTRTGTFSLNRPSPP